MGSQIDFSIGIVHPEDVKAVFALSLARAITEIGPIQTIDCHTSVIDKGRNQIAERFLNNSSKDWLLFIDSDMAFSAEDVLLLRSYADSEHPIVSGVAVRPVAGGTGETVAKRLVGTEYELIPEEELKQPCKVDGIGAAFLMVSREVLSAFPERPRRWFAFTDERQEDFEFCHRAQTLGYEVWAVPVFVGHRKAFTLYPDREPVL